MEIWKETFQTFSVSKRGRSKVKEQQEETSIEFEKRRMMQKVKKLQTFQGKKVEFYLKGPQLYYLLFRFHALNLFAGVDTNAVRILQCGVFILLWRAFSSIHKKVQ